jgi:hypothetical protein
MFLIYINKVGKDWEGNYYYEFLFSKNIDNVDGENWDSYPASGNPEPPNIKHVDKVGKITTDYVKLDLIQYSDSFSVWDAIDGIIALGWENIDDYTEVPEYRVFFKFGEKIEVVEEKLHEKGLIINYNKEGL